MGPIIIEWYIQLIIYLISFTLTLSLMTTMNWKSIISPRFQNDNWPIIIMVFFAIILSFILGNFALKIVEIGMMI